MNGVPINNLAWAIGSRLRNGHFKIRRIVWGLTLARLERRLDEQIRACSITIEREWKPRHPKPAKKRQIRQAPMEPPISL
jgi:hypothetical protein